MAKRKANQTGAGKSIWSVLNAPLVVTLIASGLAAIGGLYGYHRIELADLESRRSTYVDLLAEYEHRVSQLSDADSELNRFIGEGPTFENAKHIPECGLERDEWDQTSATVGRKEQDILRGVGSYVPTAPQFRDIDFLTLSARMERVAGIPDYQLGGVRLIRTLDWPPEVLWLTVRAYLPTMVQYGVSRHLMYTDGQLPLARGASLTKRQEAILGIPDVKPGDVERLHKENERLHARIEAELRNQSAAEPCGVTDQSRR
jgi:hypothetical protein